MGLTPDEIAQRAFTPSVDGYHQGEVRSFLERVAAQLRGLLSALPDGRSELAEPTSALHDHEPGHNDLNDRLGDMLAELVAATAAVKETQAEALTYLAAAKKLATERSAAALPGRTAEPGPTVAQVVAEHRALLELLSNEHQAVTTQLDTARKLTAEQREAAEYLATAGQQQTDQLDAADRLVEKHAAAFATGGRMVARLYEADSAPTKPAGAPTDAVAATLPVAAPVAPAVVPPTTTASPGAVRPGSGGDEPTLFGSDLDDRPLFSDNANDLLDGVLDDVMGNLTDEGEPT